MRSPIVCLLLAAACTPKPVAERPRDFLYVWTRSADTTQADFLAVLDITEDSATYGRLVTTTPAPGRMNWPHHTEHQLAADRRLFANGFDSGLTFIFDLTTPGAPRLDGQFGEVGGMVHPHTYVRLPNGNVLATFQMWHGRSKLPGGLAEITPRGEVVRSAPANLPGVNRNIRPYSAAVVPALDRIVVTTTDMDKDYPASRSILIWRLSDLKLLHTVLLPDGPAKNEGLLSAEPRVLDDGKTVLVSTFNCGLYALVGLETRNPSAVMVHSFPKANGNCALPVVAGRYYLITVPAWRAVVSLDISNPVTPREVSRAVLDSGDSPHWISMSPDRARVVVTGNAGMERKIVMLRFDSTTGALSRDDRFRDPGLAGFPHGAVFSSRAGGPAD